MGDGDCYGSLYSVGLKADQSHVADDVMDLIFQVLCCHLPFADVVAQDLVNFLLNRLLTVPEYLPLMKLLLRLFLCF